MCCRLSVDTAGISWGVTQARLDRASFSYHYRYLVELAMNLREVFTVPKILVLGICSNFMCYKYEAFLGSL